jgi:hypothetical protein
MVVSSLDGEKIFAGLQRSLKLLFLGGLSLSNDDEDAITLEGHADEDEETAAIEFIAGAEAEGDERAMSPLLLAAAAAAVVALPLFIFQK